MTELHERFTQWLIAGASEDLPRDVALHAYACPDCQRMSAAFDGLASVDLVRAPLPPSRVAPLDAAPAVPARQLMASVAVVGLVAIAIAFAGPRLLGSREGSGSQTGDVTRNEGVLAGTPMPTASVAPSPTATATSTPTSEPTSATTLAPAATPQPPAPPQPTPAPPIPPPPPPPPPQPTPAPTLAPATPAPTPAPPTPTAVPTPSPTPGPVPQCADTIDNDGDALVDWPVDPGCSNLADNDESDLP